MLIPLVQNETLKLLRRKRFAAVAAILLRSSRSLRIRGTGGCGRSQSQLAGGRDVSRSDG
jgi:hypothetical protein